MATAAATTRALSAFLTGAQPRKTDGTDIRAGVSVDQVAASRVGDRTRLPSLEIGTEAGSMAGNCDSGYSCVYSSTMAWRSATQPLPKEVKPKDTPVNNLWLAMLNRMDVKMQQLGDSSGELPGLA